MINADKKIIFEKKQGQPERIEGGEKAKNEKEKKKKLQKKRNNEENKLN